MMASNLDFFAENDEISYFTRTRIECTLHIHIFSRYMFCDSVVVKAQCYKPEGHGFDTR
jgi:hypothetical protein